MSPTTEILGEDEIEAAPPPTDTALLKLSNLADKSRVLQAELQELQDQVIAKSAELTNVLEVELPAELTVVGMRSFKMKDGFEIELIEKLYASISKDREAAAFQWFRDNNFGDLLKRQIAMAFGRGEEDQAEALAELLAETYPDHAPEDKTTIHNGTLVAWINEQKAQGNQTPDALLGVYTKRYALVKAPKVKVPKKAKA